MISELIMDRENIQNNIIDIGEQVNHVYVAVQNVSHKSISGSYSSASGFDQIGEAHGLVFSGSPGSADAVLKSYLEQASWLQQALKATFEAIQTQDKLFAHSLDNAEQNGATGTESIQFPARPELRFSDFHFRTPVVLPALTLSELSMQLQTTRVDAPVRAAKKWQVVGEKIARIATKLGEVAEQIRQNNKGDVFDAAVQRINDVANYGRTFASNTQIMGAYVSRLSTIHAQISTQVALANLAVSAITDPAARLIAEKEELARIQTQLQAQLHTAVPPIRNLMSQQASVASAGSELRAAAETSVNKIAKSDLALAGNQAFTNSASIGQLGGAPGGAGGMNPAPMHTGSAGQIPPSGLGTGSSGGLGGSNMPVPGGTGMAVPGLGGRQNGGYANGTHGVGVAPSSTNTLSGSKTPMNHMGPAPLTGRSSRRVSPFDSTVKGIGRGGSSHFGSGGGASSGGLTGSPGGVHGGTPGGLNGVGSTNHPGNGLANSNGSAGRSGAPVAGGMPMGAGGAAGAGSNRTGKAKRVMSAVEREGDLRAILGERPKVVPGVIGAWVRDEV
ncbi:hypothetical protein UL82_07665 [Corynebacterium kutscheri]|uniref:PPE family protein n=2 Tax=Corynebacterium kutscheri TaxID=35755 RepID=A0A0F6TDK6_9CORY|nr:hypothetical protein UL82_07665 [Corynebacterium kutscheri]VEH10021.1 Uncharacterised protein [Corynebacterium kutscheri]